MDPVIQWSLNHHDDSRISISIGVFEDVIIVFIVYEVGKMLKVWGQNKTLTSIVYDPANKRQKVKRNTDNNDKPAEIQFPAA